jgi:C-terminal processing protease CtpA/Prc
MKLGPVQVLGPITGLSTAKKGAMSDRNYDGNVGSGALKRFIVTFDYGRRTMYLKPATRLDPDTGHFDRTGMWLNLASRGLEVMDVAKGSPADAAGLKAGDVVTAIDGEPALQRSLSDVRSLLKTATVGTPLRVDYLRAGRPSVATLSPRKLIPSAISEAER